MTKYDRTDKLWAIIFKDDWSILYTRGGSSTKRHLMIYDNEADAQRALRSPWIRQVIPDITKVEIRIIYISHIAKSSPNN